MTDGADVYDLTAGHVVNRLYNQFTIRNRATNQAIAAFTAIKPAQGATEFASEVSIIRVKDQDRHFVNTCNSRFDMYGLNKSHPVQQTADIRDLNFKFSTVRSFALASHIGEVVYKDGITTGLTVGKLIGIRHDFAPCWATTSTSQHTYDETVPMDTLAGGAFPSFLGPRRHRWVDYVKPFPELPFSGLGDSRALLYVMQESITIPLGIHLGKRRSYGQKLAMFQSLDTHILAAELNGTDLRFESWE